VPIGIYILAPTPPVGYTLRTACWNRDITGTSGTGLSSDLASQEALTWDLGYTLSDPWVQIQGGDIFAGTIKSFIPTATVPRYFVLNGDSGYPGVVTYGTDYNFDDTVDDSTEFTCTLKTHG
jgi:hypothetical protein